MSDKSQERKQRSSQWIPILVAVAAAVAAIAAVVVALWRRRQRLRRLPQMRLPAPPAFPPSLRGLTEAEAQARQLEGQDNAILFRPPRSRRVILRENVVTIFNLSLVGLGFAQLLLGLYLDALISVGMIFVNAALNIVQEFLARRRLTEVEATTRLRSTVIREGKVRSIDPNEVVRGDILVVGPGDQLVVDGEVVGEGQIALDEALLTGKRGRSTKHVGDKVYAGTFCLSGRAAYQAQEVGTERLIATRLATAQAGKEELTPLERVIDRVLKVLLIVVGVFTAVLLVRYFNLALPVDTSTVASAVSVIFSIAPASRVFMIFLTYAAGTADLAPLGALVHRARSVESLAETTTICFAKAGILTGTQVDLETVEPPEGMERLAESRIRQILGDYVRSISVDSVATRAVATAFEGNRRVVREEAPFLSAYGWSAVAFDDDDLRGLYVLGDPLIVEAHLVAVGGATEEEVPSPPPLTAVRERIRPLGRFFRRSKPEKEETNPAAQEEEAEAPHEETQSTQPQEAAVETLAATDEGEETAEATEPEKDAPRLSFFRRATARIRRLLPGEEEEPEEPEVPEEPGAQQTVLIFAYQSELEPIHDADGSPCLPDELIPLCYLRYTERIDPEAIETIRAFSGSGISFKVFSPADPERTATLLRQAGLGTDEEEPLGAISGDELTETDAARLGKIVNENTIFGRVAPEQVALLVQALRDQGQEVTVVGDEVNDVPAMRQANLAAARHSSSQVALSVAEIVLLKGSPKVLLDVLHKGQRIVNGLLDVLRLYLTQILYLTLLIVVLMLVDAGFPYSSKQGSILAIVTVSLPSVCLSLWAAAGVLPTKNLSWLLARIVVPAGITISAAGVLVYLVFLDRTGDRAYTQLALTHALVAMGLLLVLFVRPPGRLFGSWASSTGDWRFVVVIIVLFVLFYLASWIPLADEFFDLQRLQKPLDYAIIGAVVLGWAVILRLTLWAVPVATKSERLASAVERLS